MKNIKILSIILVVTMFFSCSDDQDNTVSSNVESGWVEFLDDSPAVINYAQSIDNQASLSVNVQVPTTSTDLTVFYELVPVSGLNPNDYITTNSFTIPAGITSYAGPDNNTSFDYVNLPQLNLDLSNVPSLMANMVFDVVLTRTSSTVITAGLADLKKTVQRVSLCPIIPPSMTMGSTATGDSFSNDLDVGPGTLVPPYTVSFTPNATQANTWDLDTSWGPDFVSNLCGGCVPPGILINPLSITLNDDLSVSVSAGPNSDPGSGSYDPCSKTFTLRVPQNIFTGTFQADVVLTQD
jgi:hypothetical protein